MHAPVRTYIAGLVEAMPPRTCVVELGSRNLNGTVRDLFPGAWYLGVDLRPGPGVDVVASGARYTPPTAPDTVLCLEVLEHAECAPEIIANAYRILAPGGVFIATMATDRRAPHSGIDAGALKPGEFYRNIAPDLLASWMIAAGWSSAQTTYEVHPRRGDLYTVAWKEGRDACAEEPELLAM